MSSAIKTTDHDEIQRWVESHGGKPATVSRTRSRGDVGLIRIDFPGYSGKGSLEPIEWDAWFEKFDEQGLAFLYQEGKDTNFNKLVRRDADESREKSGRRGSPKRGASKKTTGRQPGQRGKGAGKPGRKTASRARGGSRGEDVKGWTKAQLMERARELDLPRRSGMNKEELVRALERRRS